MPSSKDLAATLAHGVASGERLPGRVRVRRHRRRHRPARLFDLRDRAEPARSQVRGAGRQTTPRDRPRPRRSAARPRLQDDRRPLRGAYLAHGGALGDPAPRHDARRQPHPRREKLHALQIMRGKETQPTSAAPRATSSRSPSSRGPHRRHPGAEEPARRGPGPEPCAHPILSIAVHPKAKGDDDKLMTAIHRLQEEDTAAFGAPRRRDAPDGALGDGRHPPGSRLREAEPQVRCRR